MVINVRSRHCHARTGSIPGRIYFFRSLAFGSVSERERERDQKEGDDYTMDNRSTSAGRVSLYAKTIPRGVAWRPPEDPCKHLPD